MPPVMLPTANVRYRMRTIPAVKGTTARRKDVNRATTSAHHPRSVTMAPARSIRPAILANRSNARIRTPYRLPG